jgi:inhibitor of cysteine peptidase
MVSMEPTITPTPNPIPENIIPQSQKSNKFVYSIILFLIMLLGVFFVYKYPDKYQRVLTYFVKRNTSSQPSQSSSILKKFASETEFKSYMNSASSQMTGLFGLAQDVAVSAPGNFGGDSIAAGKAEMAPQSGTAVDRVSETNNQVAGVDEPDIVKTDGKDIYLSNLYQIMYGVPVLEKSSIDITRPTTTTSKMIAPDYLDAVKTKIISALPVNEMAKKAEIDKSGELFLANGILSVLAGKELVAYDVSDSTSPKEIWKHTFDQRQNIISSRLINGKIYIASGSGNAGDLCLIPLTVGSGAINVNCTDIYYPIRIVPVDTVYNLLQIDLKTGKVEKINSFVGSGSMSVFYMSKENVYLTYTYFEDMVAFIYKFYSTDGRGLIPDNLLERIKTIDALDISIQSKLTELTLVLEKYKQSLTQDELLKIETETQNKLSEYMKNNIRDFEHTGIIKIKVDNLETVSSGVIPGKPLNQFSMDEYQGNLRIATTIGEGATSAYSINDVYILDSNLNLVGSVKDMGAGERIYSVRFIEDKGYLVTFKQTDPFYVLDLKDPKNPSKTGELKIPGYSSYLHKLDDNRILGVGMDGGKVKLSVFNVSDASNPVEEDKYVVDEYWSDVLNNHHAFLQDSKNSVFFVPGGRGGYVFSYKDKLSLVKAVSQSGIKRALLINKTFI